MRRILISGYIGFDNFGDEALLFVLIDNLLELNIRREDITVLSNNPQLTLEKFNVRTVNRWNFFEVFNALTASDYLICIGGIFQDKTSFKSFLYYFLQLFLAKIFGKLIVLYGVGVGPFLRKASHDLFNYALQSAEYISVRDTSSKDYITNNHHVLVTCDPVWGIEPDFSFKEFLPKINWTLPIIGVSLRSDKHFTEQQLKSLSDKLARTLNTSKDWQIVFIPCMNEEDLPVLYEIYDIVVKKVSESGRIFLLDNFDSFSVRQQAGILSYCDVMISMRFHAVLLSILGGHPVFGIITDQKIRSLIEFSKQVGVLVKDDFEHPWNYFWQNIQYSTEKAKLAKQRAIELNKRNLQLLQSALS